MGGLFSVTQLIKDPVATVGDLPSSESQIGALRVVLAGFSVYVWDGSAWHASTAPPPVPILDNTTIYYNPGGQVAVKPLGLTDNLFSPTSTVIYNWVSTVPYVVGDMVISSEGIWMCRIAGTNLTPSLSNNNWRQIANKDSSQYLTFSSYVTANYTIPTGITAVVAETTGADFTVTLPLISTIQGVLGDTTNRVQEFKVFKVGQTNKVIIACGGTDTFADGTTTFNLISNGSVGRVFVVFNKSNWFKG
jgi:hypothetical protein